MPEGFCRLTDAQRHGMRQEAAFYTRRVARWWKVDLVTHRIDGRIRSKDSYRSESSVTRHRALSHRR